MRTIPLTEAKAHLSELVDDISRSRDAVTITRHGYRSAVMLSADEFDSIMESLAWAAEPNIEADLATASAEIAQGRTIALEDAMRQHPRAE